MYLSKKPALGNGDINPWRATSKANSAVQTTNSTKEPQNTNASFPPHCRENYGFQVSLLKKRMSSGEATRFQLYNIYSLTDSMDTAWPGTPASLEITSIPNRLMVKTEMVILNIPVSLKS
jgi:hypothetical protein